MIKTLTMGALVAAMAVPSMAMADNGHRNSQRDTWKGLTIGSALVGLAGVASHNDGLAFAGAAGAVYSAYRANADNCDRGSFYYDPGNRGRDWGHDVDRSRDSNRGRDRDRGHDSRHR